MQQSRTVGVDRPAEAAVVQGAADRLAEHGISFVRIEVPSLRDQSLRVIIPQGSADVAERVRAALRPAPVRVGWYRAYVAETAADDEPGRDLLDDEDDFPARFDATCAICRLDKAVWLRSLAEEATIGSGWAIGRFWPTCAACDGLLGSDVAAVIGRLTEAVMTTKQAQMSARALGVASRRPIDP